MKEVEKGLMRISQNEFDTDNYYFQEGQYLDEETLKLVSSSKSNEDKGLNRRS